MRTPTLACAGATLRGSREACAPAAPRPRRSPASSCAGAVARSAGPPTRPAAPGPDRKASPTPGAIRSSAAAPTAPATGAAAGRGAKRGLCTDCGRNPPEEGRSVCEPCREAQRAAERARYAARRAAGACVRCAEPAIGGTSRCARHAALEAERVSPERRSAVRKKRYARRRARGVCVDCGVYAAGAARCAPCAYRSNTRAPAWHATQVGPPFYTVIEAESGIDHGTYDTEAEAAVCLAFLGLRFDQVEILSNRPLMAPSLTGVP